MSWSLGEIAALSTKAARGAGMSWGTAEEVGFAVKWLQSVGLPGVVALSNYLTMKKGTELTHWPDALDSMTSYCPIMSGTAFSDGAMPTEISLERVFTPLLLIPFIAVRANTEIFFLKIGPFSMFVNKNGISNSDCEMDLTSGSLKFNIHRKSCDVIKSFNLNTSKITRTSSDQKIYVEKLEWFAQKTYAPSTETSRTTGAGSGVSDND